MSAQLSASDAPPVTSTDGSKGDSSVSELKKELRTILDLEAKMGAGTVLTKPQLAKVLRKLDVLDALAAAGASGF